MTEGNLPNGIGIKGPQGLPLRPRSGLRFYADPQALSQSLDGCGGIARVTTSGT
jgi:hypothetical protein